MAGKSDQEKAAERQYSTVSKFNPTARNRFEGMQLPFDPKSFGAMFDRGTGAGAQLLKKQTKQDVGAATKATTAGLQSRGAGGSVLQDAIAKARAGVSAGGTNALQKFMVNRLGQKPQVLAGANQQSLAIPQLAQGESIGMLGDDTWLDDVLAVGNTAANIGSAFI